MREVKLSTKNQIVIPREIRDALGVKAGDRLLVVSRGDTVILLRKPKKYSKAIAGMGDFSVWAISLRREKAGSSSGSSWVVNFQALSSISWMRDRIG
jgi:AbrB family looped-hinge helix DNA binding protein